MAAGQACFLGCSGGADSIALARVLVALGHPVELVYVDHRSRADSAQDGEAVATLAASLGCAVRLLAIPDTTVASEAGWRAARYAVLDALPPGVPVALGHTRDDQAETVLFRLLRGTGTAGLAGIPPRRGRYVRPLLDEPRSEITRYLRALGQPWREDPSNTSDRFARNRLRHTVLPVLLAESPRLVEHLASLAHSARDEREVLEQLASEHLAQHKLSLRPLRAAPAAIQAHVLRAACPVALSAERTAALVALLSSERPGVVELGEGVSARRVGRGAAAQLQFDGPPG